MLALNDVPRFPFLKKMTKLSRGRGRKLAEERHDSSGETQSGVTSPTTGAISLGMSALRMHILLLGPTTRVLHLAPTVLGPML